MNRPPGSIERLPHGNFTFKAPVPQMLREKVIRQRGPKRYVVVDSTPVTIQMPGIPDMILPQGTEFFVVDWDSKRVWQNCRLDFFTK